MPRRPPPSSLRLIQGPTPARGYVKHTLPSVPHPTLCVSSREQRTPARNSGAAPVQQMPAVSGSAYTPYTLPNTSTTSVSQSSTPSSATSTKSAASPPLRGPWDHSRSLAEVLQFDVESVLAPPKPAAISPTF